MVWLNPWLPQGNDLPAVSPNRLRGANGAGGPDDRPGANRMSVSVSASGGWLFHGAGDSGGGRNHHWKSVRLARPIDGGHRALVTQARP